MSTDVAVIGFGGAGAAAAIAAADRGADVLIVETQADGEHNPTTGMSGGIVMATRDAERATAYLDLCAEDMVPTAVSRMVAFGSADLPRWLDGIGADLQFRVIRGAQHSSLPGADSIDVFTTTLRSSLSPDALRAGIGIVSDPTRSHGETGGDLFVALRACVRRRDRIAVAWSARAARLLTSGGRVVGVEAVTPSGPLTIEARRGVVLATGGFVHNEEMKRNYLRAYPMHFSGSSANTGDGIQLAQSVGAGLWHMNLVIGRGCLHFERDGVAFNFNPSMYPFGASFARPAEWGHVLTTRHGRRYADESEAANPVKHNFIYRMFEYDAERGEYPRIPSWWIFDRRRLDAGPLTSVHIGLCGAGLYEWSADNRKEVAQGWIHEGATPAEAAAKAGITDPRALEEEVAAYNGSCVSGADAFGRPRQTLVPLDQPPYYAVALYPGGTTTCGGPRIDEHARVLDPFGQPISGLYAAGEISLPFGPRYASSGCCLTAALVQGRVAGEFAASS